MCLRLRSRCRLIFDQIKQGEEVVSDRLGQFAERRSGSPAGHAAAGPTLIVLPALCFSAGGRARRS